MRAGAEDHCLRWNRFTREVWDGTCLSKTWQGPSSGFGDLSMGLRKRKQYNLHEWSCQGWLHVSGLTKWLESSQASGFDITLLLLYLL